MTDYDPDEHCGHDTADGSPCLRTTGGELCWSHDGEGDPGGRPSKLSYERQEKIAGWIEQGRSMTSAARMAGVSPETVFNWMDRGRDEEEGEYNDFFNRITRAKGEGEEYYMRSIVEMAKEEGDHRFLASLMKQRFPEAWSEAETGVDADKTVINLPESVTDKWEREAKNR